MRNNRIWMMVILLTVVFILGGCMNVQDLTEKESEMIAEYSAGLLLQYSDQYERRLIKKNPAGVNEIAQPSAVPSETAPPAVPEETPVPAAPETPEGEPGTEGAGSQDTSMEGPDAASGQSVEEDNTDKVSLNDLFHIKGLDFSYRSYQFCDKYPKGGDGIIPITAGKDETLLVVHFQIRNKSGAKKKVSLGRRANNISYKLKVDGSEYEPGISILKNTGLNYLNTKIRKGGKEDAVLVYTMSKERRQASGITLRIQEGNKAVDLQLK